MKELKIIQKSTGQYNLLSSEKQFCFSIGIFENNQLIKVNNIAAKLEYTGKPEELEESIFCEPYYYLEEVWTKCNDYAQRVLSTKNYKAQCMTFAKIYQENIEEIETSMEEKRKENILNSIEKLVNELKEEHSLPSLTVPVNSSLNKRINQCKAFIKLNHKKLRDIKEGTDSFDKINQQIQTYSKEINMLEGLLL